MTGNDLRDARHGLGLSQAGLGALLGIPPNTIARWERGERAIRHPRMLRLALMQLQKGAPNEPTGADDACGVDE